MKVPAFEMPLEEIRASLDKLRRPLSIAVLRARNPFNVGAIIRVAHSFLVREIILVGSERYYERGAMGMDRYENIVCVADEAALIAQCAPAAASWWCSRRTPPASPCGKRRCRPSARWCSAARRPASPTRSSAPPTWSSASRCTASTIRSPSPSPPASRWPNGHVGTTPAYAALAPHDRQRLHVRRVGQHVERRDAAGPVAARREQGEVASEGVRIARQIRDGAGRQAHDLGQDLQRAAFSGGFSTTTSARSTAASSARRHRRRSARSPMPFSAAEAVGVGDGAGVPLDAEHLVAPPAPASSAIPPTPQ